MGVPSSVEFDPTIPLQRLDLEHTQKGSAALWRTTYPLSQHSQTIDDWVDNGDTNSKLSISGGTNRCWTRTYI